jgi:hypothetical protein
MLNISGGFDCRVEPLRNQSPVPEDLLNDVRRVGLENLNIHSPAGRFDGLGVETRRVGRQ